MTEREETLSGDAHFGELVYDHYESSQTSLRREAEALLRERELREERRRLGLEVTLSNMKLGRAVTMFLDETQVLDRAVSERNRKAVHPVLRIEFAGRRGGRGQWSSPPR